MAKKREDGVHEVAKSTRKPKSVALAERGFTTSADFIATAGAAVADVLGGNIEVERARAAASFMGRIIQMLDMEHKLGNDNGKIARRIIPVAGRALPEADR